MGVDQQRRSVRNTPVLIPDPLRGRRRATVSAAPGLIETGQDVRALAIGLGLCLTLAGCASPNVEDRTANEPSTETSNIVSAATWTDGPWPFTIEGGELICIASADDLGVFIVTESGETFALNPAAIRMADQVGAMADLDPIWRWRDPDLPTARVNLSPLILYALQLC